MTEFFSSDEIKVLREHGIELFAGRVIFEAQPPMTPEEIALIQSQCSGPIPRSLVELWSQTAGGHLDYDLIIQMGGREESIGWTELFFNGSDHYRDLQGWIEHEIELAQEAAEQDEEDAEEDKDDDESASNASHEEDEEDLELDDGDFGLSYLPFGGFEYCDRIYVVVAAGREYGQILAWKQGLPPAWTHAMHEDAVATVGPDLHAAFQALCLHEDPLAPVSDYYAGEDLKEYIQMRVGEHGLAKALADRLIEFYRQAIIDWRTPLANKTIGRHPQLGKIALSHAIETDDADLIANLVASAVSIDEPVQGAQLPTVTAMSRGSFRAAQALVKAGAAVSADAFSDIDGAIPADLVCLLLLHGAEPTPEAIAQCVACGVTASAREIAEAYSMLGCDTAGDYANAKKALLEDLEKSLDEVRRGKLGHYLGEEGLASRVANLRKFAL